MSIFAVEVTGYHNRPSKRALYEDVISADDALPAPKRSKGSHPSGTTRIVASTELTDAGDMSKWTEAELKACRRSLRLTRCQSGSTISLSCTSITFAEARSQRDREYPASIIDCLLSPNSRSPYIASGDITRLIGLALGGRSSQANDSAFGFHLDGLIRVRSDLTTLYSLTAKRQDAGNGSPATLASSVELFEWKSLQSLLDTIASKYILEAGTGLYVYSTAIDSTSPAAGFSNSSMTVTRPDPKSPTSRQNRVLLPPSYTPVHKTHLKDDPPHGIAGPFPQAVHFVVSQTLREAGDIATWNQAELSSGRRLIRLTRAQNGWTVHLDGVIIQEYDEVNENGVVVNCLLLPNAVDAQLTSQDMLRLLAFAMKGGSSCQASDWQLSREEKKRIRRQLDTKDPFTVKRHDPVHPELYKFLAGLGPPSPIARTHDVSLFRWSVLPFAAEHVAGRMFYHPAAKLFMTYTAALALGLIPPPFRKEIPSKRVPSGTDSSRLPTPSRLDAPRRMAPSSLSSLRPDRRRHALYPSRRRPTALRRFAVVSTVTKASTVPASRPHSLDHVIRPKFPDVDLIKRMEDVIAMYA